MILWQMTESISTGKLSSAKIPQAQRAQSMWGRQQPRRWLCAHSEPHKSSQARTAPLTLTQEMSEEEEEEEGGQAWGGRNEKGERKEMYFSFSLLICCCFYLYELMKSPHHTVFVKTDTTHIQREEANRQRNGTRDRRGDVGDGKMILRQIWFLKHPWVEE